MFFFTSNTIPQGWDWDLGQNISNYQPTSQAENLESEANKA